MVIDATGLKVYGASEWLVAKHGERGTRTWRKLHLAVDPSTGEILASELTTNEEGDASQVGPLLGQIPGQIASVTADGPYDGEPVYQAVSERQPDPPVAVIIPPRSTAVPSTAASTTPSQRDQHIQMIQAKGRMGWQKAVGYGRRSHAETAMFRYKALIGSSLRARTLPAQKTEAKAACSVLNRMTSLGMPCPNASVESPLGLALHVHNLNCAPEPPRVVSGPAPTFAARSPSPAARSPAAAPPGAIRGSDWTGTARIGPAAPASCPRCGQAALSTLNSPGKGSVGSVAARVRAGTPWRGNALPSGPNVGRGGGRRASMGR